MMKVGWIYLDAPASTLVDNTSLSNVEVTEHILLPVVVPRFLLQLFQFQPWREILSRQVFVFRLHSTVYQAHFRE